MGVANDEGVWLLTCACWVYIGDTLWHGNGDLHILHLHGDQTMGNGNGTYTEWE